MRFLETPIFTRAIESLLSDDDYRSFQIAMVLRPRLGPVIPGSGGLRKVRWSSRGKGKRGGSRVIYYWDQQSDTFYMLYAYGKSEREDLTVEQLRMLRRLVREEFG
jgi:mRNA-degrading endonuclease RelE of RelBE toxin-antitoxin system